MSPCNLLRDLLSTFLFLNIFQLAKGSNTFLIYFFYPLFHGKQLFLVATILSHRYNSRTASGETKVESHASSDTQPNQATLLLNTACIQPGSQPH
jgi:hypothetical protein